jgi:hypothetical protein
LAASDGWDSWVSQSGVVWGQHKKTGFFSKKCLPPKSHNKKVSSDQPPANDENSKMKKIPRRKPQLEKRLKFGRKKKGVRGDNWHCKQLEFHMILRER